MGSYQLKRTAHLVIKSSRTANEVKTQQIIVEKHTHALTHTNGQPYINEFQNWIDR